MSFRGRLASEGGGESRWDSEGRYDSEGAIELPGGDWNPEGWSFEGHWDSEDGWSGPEPPRLPDSSGAFGGENADCLELSILSWPLGVVGGVWSCRNHLE